MAEWMNDFYSDTELLPRFTALDLALTPKLKSAKWLLQTWFNKPHIEEITNSWMRVKQTFLLDQSSIKQIFLPLKRLTGRVSRLRVKRRVKRGLKPWLGSPWDPSHGFFRATLRIFIIFTNAFMNLLLTYLLMFSINSIIFVYYASFLIFNVHLGSQGIPCDLSHAVGL